ncbi:MAG TPA: ATP-binding cassette domain-containing protein [Anaeromyxobacteraceae bacterium]|nr:ATP-binding cassette domain-containing protein [Anaeromyxobacteraceae bacterium]
MSAAIQLEGVSILRDGRKVLADVSLRVPAGETLSILGSSGSGKTTLLRVVAGFIAPQLGGVRIGDVLVSDRGRIVIAPEERDVAMVFQDLALWPHLTVHGNLVFGLQGKKVPRTERDARVAAILARVGLSGKERRHPGELSGGERQRVAIARALVLDPCAVLFDEPLSNLDLGLIAWTNCACDPICHSHE